MSRLLEPAWICFWCGSRHKLATIGADKYAATAESYGERLRARGVRSDTHDILTGLTVLGGYGWSLDAGSVITMAIESDRFVFAGLPLTQRPTVIAYDNITGFEFEGGVTQTGTQLMGGGFGVAGAAAGMLAAGVLNALTNKTRANSVVRISGLSGEIYLHRGDVLPDQLRTVLGPAVNAVANKLQTVESSGAPSEDPVEQLRTLAELHTAGALTAEEFALAKSQILSKGV